MSDYRIKIPDVGEGITEVELVEWFVHCGQEIAEDQPVASVMTEKVSVEISSPVAGQVVALGGQVGEILAVGADLVKIDLRSVESVAADVLTKQKSAVEIIAEPLSIDPVITESVLAPALASVTSPHERLLQKVQASPAVRKRAADLSIDLTDLANKIGKNQLTHADLDLYLMGHTDGHIVPTVSQITTIPIQGVRRQIAQKMLQSTQNIPHFSYIEAVDVTALEQWRQQLNTQWADSRGHLTLLPFLVKALCLTLVDHPQMNSRYNAANNVLEQYADVHIAIATQTSMGLMVPVLSFAQRQTLWEIAANIKQLVAEAHEGKISLTAKSTLTLSSLGALGGVAATPIINAPEIAIVGVNKQTQQPVVIDGQITIRTIMNLSSSFDHRFIDGVHAAQFIQDLRAKLESPQLYFMG